MIGLTNMIHATGGATSESRDHDLSVYDHTDDTGNTILNVLSNQTTK